VTRLSPESNNEDNMNNATIRIPASRHPSLDYGSHWSNQMGQSGHYVRSNSSQDYVRAVERPDLSWGTSKEQENDDTIMTLADARSSITWAQTATDEDEQ